MILQSQKLINPIKNIFITLAISALGKSQSSLMNFRKDMFKKIIFKIIPYINYHNLRPSSVFNLKTNKILIIIGLCKET